jgi:hypothetical protein
VTSKPSQFYSKLGLPSLICVCGTLIAQLMVGPYLSLLWGLSILSFVAKCDPLILLILVTIIHFCQYWGHCNKLFVCADLMPFIMRDQNMRILLSEEHSKRWFEGMCQSELFKTCYTNLKDFGKQSWELFGHQREDLCHGNKPGMGLCAVNPLHFLAKVVWRDWVGLSREG